MNYLSKYLMIIFLKQVSVNEAKPNRNLFTKPVKAKGLHVRGQKNSLF